MSQHNAMGKRHKPIVIRSDSEELEHLEQRSTIPDSSSSSDAHPGLGYVNTPSDRSRHQQRQPIVIRSDSEEREEPQRLLAHDRAQKGALLVSQLSQEWEEQQALREQQKARKMWDEAEKKGTQSHARRDAPPTTRSLSSHQHGIELLLNITV
ncbi:uncharacterized protein BDZ99DRAFT_198986 [Mytilinidion resinicola]|uniref:Uncharacterized protein n=1 Tax=Mytilinidion resinicola TaxID=574789 RepID=A0A6A6Y1K6_9PEZI|nr:uncharacterized protein BDZ99DRAFT_198986 [Mytilinidion resinicola]KAF2802701.1 hypothetical protein BDZ99DRAFT_198986 [Mytilinidion resinicola]